ncbi:hypothetical protein [Pseudomonas savastanoi]|nr:hypothetical protein [Pseudomonas savastanoi]
MSHHEIPAAPAAPAGMLACWHAGMLAFELARHILILANKESAQ